MDAASRHDGLGARLRRLALVAWTGPRSTLVLLRVALGMLGAGWMVITLASPWSLPGFDAFAYWSVNLASLYPASRDSGAGTFRYSPVIGQLLDPLGAMPWEFFFVLWLVASMLALVVLGGRWALALLLVPSVVGEIYLGNIDLFIALALGFGLVFPLAWVFLVLTKVTPAVVILWFLARGQWRNLAIVLGGVLLVAMPSLMTTPGLWVDWAKVSTQFAATGYGASALPVLPRLIVAAAMVIVGARRDWRWTIAVAGTLAMPGLEWKTVVVVLAILPLYGLGLRADWGWIRGRGHGLHLPQPAGHAGRGA